jgi:ABC-type lipoprotein export system ATPase subunit
MKFKPNKTKNQHRQIDPNAPLIDLKRVEKVYKTEAGDFPALKGINLQIGAGEFVSVIGKSGSGKTTLINMLTGIDRPTGGELLIGGVPLHQLSEGEMATWRGKQMGVVFQFFQLLPSLTVLQNVMIPMDFCNMFDPKERRERAMHLLDLVGIAEHANKPPSKLSGGQQQRAAIARALANDPPIIATDEPTGNLDSATANQIFDLFQKLVDEGKTILMVTHDEDLASRATRTVIIADGEIVNEYLVEAMPTLSHQTLLRATRNLRSYSYGPGEVIIRQGDDPDRFYIVTNGTADVYITRENGRDVFVDRVKRGRYFGEIALFQGGRRSAMVRSSESDPVEVISLAKSDFDDLLIQSEEMRTEIERSVFRRRETLASVMAAVGD